MRFVARAEGRTLEVEVRRQGGRYRVGVEGRHYEFEVRDEACVSFLAPILELASGPGLTREIAVEKQADGGFLVHFADGPVRVALSGTAAADAPQPGSGASRVVSPMPGRVARLLVAPGREVAAGQGLLVLEAMKMENELRAARAGRVSEVAVQEGQTVEAGALLVVIA